VSAKFWWTSEEGRSRERLKDRKTVIREGGMQELENTGAERIKRMWKCRVGEGGVKLKVIVS
jgi:hypothetical protein